VVLSERTRAVGSGGPTLHLIRHAPPPDGVVTPDDLVLEEVDGAWVTQGAVVSDADLVDLVARATRVAVW
jgi:hypothetical protein